MGRKTLGPLTQEWIPWATIPFSNLLSWWLSFPQSLLSIGPGNVTPSASLPYIDNSRLFPASECWSSWHQTVSFTSTHGCSPLLEPGSFPSFLSDLGSWLTVFLALSLSWFLAISKYREVSLLKLCFIVPQIFSNAFIFHFTPAATPHSDASIDLFVISNCNLFYYPNFAYPILLPPRLIWPSQFL